MGEVLPNSIPLMAAAAKDAGLTLNGTVAEMLALQQKGGLISSKVLPHFAKQMHNAASANGALEQALKSNRVAMNQMVTGFQMASDTIFKSGWSEGLTDIFKSTGEMLKENEHTFKAFGKIMGKIFSGISWVIDNIIAPALSAFGSLLNSVSVLLEKMGGWATLLLIPLAKISPLVKLATFALRMFGITAATAMLPMLATVGAVVAGFTLILGVIEEISEFFNPTGKKTYIGFNIEDIKPPQWLTDFMSFTKDDKKIGEVLKPTAHTYSMYGIKPTSTPVTMYSDIYIGKEKIGQAVSSSNAVQTQIANQVAEATSSNH